MNNEEKILSMLTAIQTDITEMKGDIVDLKSDMAEVKSDIVDLKSDMAEVKSDIVDLKGDMAEVKSDIVEMKTTMATLATKKAVSNLYENLKNLINEAARDAARTEKLLYEHISQPMH